MTESEWLVCADPRPMLRHLRGKASDRKLRLFAVVCCRKFLNLLDDRCRAALETVERFADNHASPAELRSALEAAHASFCEFDDGECNESAADAVASTCWSEDLEESARKAAWSAVFLPAYLSTRPLMKAKRRLAGQVICRLLRELFGNPFRVVGRDRSWLPSSDHTFLKLAQSIYAARTFDRLPILADALEEAGCTDADILAHCRQPGEHVRGCWVVDLLLGKS